jgi:predicted GH43/DUF377 family glycosyl hydrolase
MILYVGILILSGCHPGGSNSPVVAGIDYNKISPDCYVTDAANPILEKGDLLTNATWNDPHVMKVGSQYLMYASADNNFDQDVGIYRLISNDGKSWSLSPNTPVLEKSSGAADWDRKSVETPAVVKFNNKWYLFYTGYPVSQSDATSYQIGYATSNDGISWTKQSAILSPSGVNMDFHEFIVAEPAPVVFKNKIYLYFTALGANASVGTTLQTIGLITSSDGVNWTAPEKVLEPDQQQYPRNSNWKGYSTPNAIVMDNKVHLYFDVVTDTPFEQVKLHHAVSSNGISAWIQDSQEIFDRSEFSPWADVSLRSPSVVLDGKILRLYFAGNGDTSAFPDVPMGIGLASCHL